MRPAEAVERHVPHAANEKIHGAKWEPRPGSWSGLTGNTDARRWQSAPADAVPTLRMYLLTGTSGRSPRF